ncbi:homospermidine synthase [Legionella quinlivanii]|uniref:Homospermidine synthase n=1 Tax=Legionella quinlivanii TaxID=45073 RepID=A0A0W0Y519_9GAMM|nr:saccharopine dehydrogenase C-terminal domain-containing protein [Legionella quinlivanii]KTD52061.1 homospermidine synthase [Legionella quinlivanii]SEF88965.1 homospermidine synthase [Legionella quinlivanii DSM 21216]STY12443.1 homospermidine synthase [Legionella quinlivanii]
MSYKDTKYHRLDSKILILGFGSVGQAIVPLLLHHLEMSPSQIIVLTQDTIGEAIAKEQGLSFVRELITRNNYLNVLNELMNPGDFLINLSTGISSHDLIKYCQQKHILYLDACTEPWLDVKPKQHSFHTRYDLRQGVLKLKEEQGATAILTHGANPGLVSHFIRQALWNMAQDNELSCSLPATQAEWAKLAHTLGIKVIHIAERDTQVSNRFRVPGEFVNTWSAEGLIAEASQPAELSWGTHERHWPEDAIHHTFTNDGAIYLKRTGASTKVRTWTPTHGPFYGFLITHAESLTIADFLTIKNDREVSYRPTVHYAYYPCPDATLSLQEYEASNWTLEHRNRLIIQDVVEGTDELGVLLMGNKKGAYWYGSQLSIHEARKLVPYNNATSLQVAAGVLAGVIWALKNPNRSIVEPEDIDFQFALQIAWPYLGKVAGYYTRWTPLENRQRLFSEKLDMSDPWQFLNIRVE